MLTDVLTQSFISSPGLLISLRMRALFQEFNLDEFEFVPVVVEDKHKTLHEYFWLHQPADPLTRIDYVQTYFEVRELEGKVVSRFKVGSLKELATRTLRIVGMEVIPENNLLRLKPPGYEADMITFDTIYRERVFVEERLALRLEEAGFTGYDITSTVLEIV